MRKGFTLIELLVVIAIIAILAVVVVLTLNPAALLQQSRDSQRVSDMATLTSAINLYNTDQSGASSYSLGSASMSYMSIFDSSATSTAGDQCQGLSMPTAIAYSYHCAASSTYRMVNSTGWIPVNFQNISAGSPLGVLPVDPTNQTSSDLYYTYETNGNQWTLNSFFESSKYAKTMESSGGADPALDETGPGAGTLPDIGRGLVGYWPLDEGTGSTTIDWSGNGNNGTWSGTAAGTSGYYSPGHVWQWGGVFDGATTYVNIPDNAIFDGNIGTWILWFNISTPSAGNGYPLMIKAGNSASINGIVIDEYHGTIGYTVKNATTGVAGAATSYTTSTWHQVALTFNSGGTYNFYLDGSLINSQSTSTSFLITSSTQPLRLGKSVDPYWQVYLGLIGDVRIYNRTLSAAEIQELYNAER